MTDKQKLDAIKAEIHRLVDVRGYDREMANDLLAFMNSLPNEPVSDDLEGAAENYASTDEVLPNGKVMIDFQAEKAFKAGANWQKEQMLPNTADAVIGLPYENRYGGYTQLIDVSRPLPIGNNKIAIIFKEKR